MATWVVRFVYLMKSVAVVANKQTTTATRKGRAGTFDAVDAPLRSTYPLSVYEPFTSTQSFLRLGGAVGRGCTSPGMCRKQPLSTPRHATGATG